MGASRRYLSPEDRRHVGIVVGTRSRADVQDSWASRAYGRRIATILRAHAVRCLSLQTPEPRADQNGATAQSSASIVLAG
jgi:hypothetical protein